MVAEAATAHRSDRRGAEVETVEAIRLDHLVRRYGEREALADVSVTLARGETLAVMGRNGAGKTTPLRVLATPLLPHGGSVQALGGGSARRAADRPQRGLHARTRQP